MSNNYNEDDSEEEWGTHELIIDRFPSENKSENTKADAKLRADEEEEEEVGGDNKQDAYFQSDEYWNDDKNESEKHIAQNEADLRKNNQENHESHSDEGVPMFILDVTKLNPDIHSKYDRNSVNDPEGASKIRRKFERDYHNHTDSALIADGTVVPCSTSVWQAALAKMRRERKGHYFLPIFPPK